MPDRYQGIVHADRSRNIPALLRSENKFKFLPEHLAPLSFFQWTFAVEKIRKQDQLIVVSAAGGAVKLYCGTGEWPVANSSSVTGAGKRIVVHVPDTDRRWGYKTVSNSKAFLAMCKAFGPPVAVVEGLQVLGRHSFFICDESGNFFKRLDSKNEALASVMLSHWLSTSVEREPCPALGPLLSVLREPLAVEINLPGISYFYVERNGEPSNQTVDNGCWHVALSGLFGVRASYLPPSSNWAYRITRQYKLTHERACWLVDEYLPKLGKVLAAMQFQYGFYHSSHTQNVSLIVSRHTGEILSFVLKDHQDVMPDPIVSLIRKTEFLAPRERRLWWGELNRRHKAVTGARGRLPGNPAHPGQNLRMYFGQCLFFASKSRKPAAHKRNTEIFLKSYLQEVNRLTTLSLGKRATNVGFKANGGTDSPTTAYGQVGHDLKTFEDIGKWFAEIMQRTYDDVVLKLLSGFDFESTGNQAELSKIFLSADRAHRTHYLFPNARDLFLESKRKPSTRDYYYAVNGELGVAFVTRFKADWRIAALAY